MITNDGKDAIMRYLAGYVSRIGDLISVGIGSSPESATDNNLQFEITSQTVQQIGADMAAGLLIFKVTLPAGITGRIKEVSLWTGRQVASGNATSEIVTLVDNLYEQWTGGTWATGSKINDSTLLISTAASSSAGASPETYAQDLSMFTARDNIVVAYEVVANVASLRLDFGTDANNRYSAVINNPPVGYNITAINFGSFVKTGTPDWANTTYLAAVVTASSAGAGSVKLDGIRINQALVEGIMVSRKVLPQEIVKERNAPLDIEYSMPVTIV